MYRHKKLFIATSLLFFIYIQITNTALFGFDPMLPYYLIFFIITVIFFDNSKTLDNTFLNSIMRNITTNSNIYILEMLSYLTHIRKISYLVKEAETAMVSHTLFHNLKDSTSIAFNIDYKKFIINDFFKRVLAKTYKLTKISDATITQLDNKNYTSLREENAKTIAFKLSVTWTLWNNRTSPKDRYVICPNQPFSLYEISSPIQMDHFIYLYRILKKSGNMNLFENKSYSEYMIKEFLKHPPYCYDWLNDIFTVSDDIRMALWRIISKLEPYTDEELDILEYYNVDLNSITCEYIKGAAIDRLDLPTMERPCNENNWIDRDYPEESLNQ